MKTNISIFILPLLLLSCTAKTTNKDAEAPLTNTTTTAPSQETCDEGNNAIIYSFNHFKTDTRGYRKYQTFDEFSMQGKGRATAQPYVMVKRIMDTIVVKSNLAMDSMRVYYKLPCGTWYSHMEYDMEKKMDMACKCEECRTARTYDRYIYNDTIVEINTGFIEGEKFPRVIVKTRRELFTISSLGKHGHAYPINHKLRSSVYEMIHSEAKNVNRYELKEYPDKYSYESERGISLHEYPKKAYGLWGIQPGVDETYIFEGQDIRNFTNDHPNGVVLEDDTVIYELADQMPQYPGGIEEFTKISHVTIRNQTVTTNKRIRVVVECVVEKDGSLSNLWINKRNILEYDEKAIDIVKKIARFTPAVLNGEKVRCKIQIPITFLFKQERNID